MNENTKKIKKEIVLSEDRGFKGVWIPENLYLTREFSPNEKFVLVEIYSLSKSKNKKCFASNKHFADFVGLKENSIQKMLLKFEKNGYIKRIYEYRDGTKEIESRTLILTNKFYKAFINEYEKKDSYDMEKNPQGGGFESFERIEKNPCGDGNNSIISNTDFNDNNDFKNTSLSDTDKGRDINTVNGEADTSFPKKRLPAPDKKKTKEELKKLEMDMFKRFGIIGSQYDTSETAYENIIRAFRRYLNRFTERTDKVHPILKDETLEKIFVTLATISDTEYSHFDNAADYEPDDNGLSYLDKMVDEYFDSEHSNNTDWHISYFARQEYLEKMAQHIVDY